MMTALLLMAIAITVLHMADAPMGGGSDDGAMADLASEAVDAAGPSEDGPVSEPAAEGDSVPASGAAPAQPSSDLEPSEPQSLEDVASAAVADFEKAPTPPQAPQPALQTPPDGVTPADFLQRLGVDQEALASLDPRAQEIASNALRSWIDGSYVPAVTDLMRVHQEQQQWAQQIEQYQQQPTFQWAAWLQQPENQQAFNAFLEHMQNPQGGEQTPQLPMVNVDNLDEETRAVYEHAQYAQQQVEALQAELGAMRQQHYEFQQTSDDYRRQTQEAADQRAWQGAGHRIDNVANSASQHYGFDVRTRPEEWRQVQQYVLDKVKAATHDAVVRGTAATGPTDEQLQMWFREAFKYVGFPEIKRRMAQQRAGAAPPVTQRAVVPQEPESMESIVDDAVDEFERGGILAG